jgi:hypothetical protein
VLDMNKLKLVASILTNLKSSAMREKEWARVRCVLETFHDAINKPASGPDSRMTGLNGSHSEPRYDGLFRFDMPFSSQPGMTLPPGRRET